MIAKLNSSKIMKLFKNEILMKLSHGKGLSMSSKSETAVSSTGNEIVTAKIQGTQC